ncbi:hypothetical protein [Mesomycoplasma neurolyticum]|uniref:hypothetical protein n=1 Tax=Mesomycoplasma neurolyticum TaxID=2120 RepID=UPI0013EE144C|nr:hypothetical protein [Mesomycoplasma neurolyticum]
MQDLKLIILSLLIFILVIISSLSSASETSFLSIKQPNLKIILKINTNSLKRKF